MHLNVPYKDFENRLQDTAGELGTLSASVINDEPALARAHEQLKDIRQRCSDFILQSASEDFAGTFSKFIRPSNSIEGGVHPFQHRKRRFLERVRSTSRTIDYMLSLVRVSDPLTSERSYTDERAELTVDAKAGILLQKLYGLRKADDFWDAGLIFKLNEVALDNRSEASEIVRSLGGSGWVKVAPTSMGVEAKITTEGKAYYESLLAKSKVQVNESEEVLRSIPEFVNHQRIQELEQLNHPDFDFTRLVQYCHELNDNYESENYLSVAMIGRSIINHIPPVFGFSTFNEVANNYGRPSFKKNMLHLNNSMKNIAESFLHDTIRKRESLPNATTVNFWQDLDVLLAEVVRRVREEEPTRV